jgi:hypothetical protein
MLLQSRQLWLLQEEILLLLLLMCAWEDLTFSSLKDWGEKD